MATDNLNLNDCNVDPKIAYGTIEYFGRGIGEVLSPYRTFVLPESSLAQLTVPDGSVPTEEQWAYSLDTNMPKHTHCQHMSNALPRAAADKTIRAAMSLILSKNIQFDTFVFRGMSGAIFAPILAHLMNKEMILVRKDKGKNCASGRWVEGYKQARRYILVDDLICSGNSAVDTILAVKVFTNSKAELVNVLLYDSQVELLSADDSYGSVGVKVLMERAQSKFEAGEHTSAQW